MKDRPSSPLRRTAAILCPVFTPTNPPRCRRMCPRVCRRAISALLKTLREKADMSIRTLTNAFCPTCNATCLFRRERCVTCHPVDIPPTPVVREQATADYRLSIEARRAEWRRRHERAKQRRAELAGRGGA